MEKSFSKVLHNFLIDRCDSIIFSEVSPQYKKADEEADRFYDEIKSQLSEEGQKTLLKFKDWHCAQVAVAGNAAYQKGFGEGLQFILYLLIS